MRILIVEDEPVVTRRLARLFDQILDGRERTIDSAETLEEARDTMGRRAYDVLCLDLNLHGRDGFDLLATAVAGPHQTIVVSANTDRALEAFEYGVIDFVPKPFGRERLEKALDRVKPGVMPDARRARFLAFRHGNRTEVIEVERVRAIHGADNYAEVELNDGRRRLHDKTLDQLQGLLPAQFVRVHRCHILNLRHIAELKSLPGSRYLATLDSDESVPVSRRCIRMLRQRLV